ncbi:unnamed protein product, partial [Symbiodinium sp. CCMP2456]
DTGVGRLDPEMPEAGAGDTRGPAAKAEPGVDALPDCLVRGGLECCRLRLPHCHYNENAGLPAVDMRLPWSEQAEAWEVYLQALASFLSAGLSMVEFEQLSTAEKIAAIPENYIAA